MNINIINIFVFVVVFYAGSCPGHVEAQTIIPITSASDLPQGLFYDEDDNVLYYVDTVDSTVNRLDLNTQDLQTLYLELAVGFILPLCDSPYQFIVGEGRDLVLLTWNYDGVEQFYTTCLITSVEPYCQDNRWNDGKADSYGRFWGGTTNNNSKNDCSCCQTSVYRVETLSAGCLTADVAINSVISNGLVWSLDSRVLYNVDLNNRQVVSYRYDLLRGVICCPSVVFRYQDYEELQGIPNGITIDYDGNLWISSYQDGAVIKVNPNTGELLQVIPLPVTLPTSLVFGDLSYTTLFVTSERQDEPESGTVLAILDLGVTGAPSHKAGFNGCCTPLY